MVVGNFDEMPIGHLPAASLRVNDTNPRAPTGKRRYAIGAPGLVFHAGMTNIPKVGMVRGSCFHTDNFIVAVTLVWYQEIIVAQY